MNFETVIVGRRGTVSATSGGGYSCHEVVSGAHIGGSGDGHCRVEVITLIVGLAVIGGCGVGGEENLEETIGDGSFGGKGDRVLRLDFAIDDVVVVGIPGG